MTIITLAEEVEFIAKGGDPNSENNIGFRTIQEKIGEKIDLEIRKFLDIENRDEKNQEYRVNFDFLKEYELPVTDLKATFVVHPLNLPKNKGIYEVRQHALGDDECNEFSVLIPMQVTKGMSLGRESDDLGGYLGYYLRGNQIIVDFKGEGNGPTKLFADIVPSYKTFPKDEEFVLPGVITSNAKLATLKELFPMYEIPHDIKQDNTDSNDWKKHKHDS